MYSMVNVYNNIQLILYIIALTTKEIVLLCYHPYLIGPFYPTTQLFTLGSDFGHGLIHLIYTHLLKNDKITPRVPLFVINMKEMISTYPQVYRNRSGNSNKSFRWMVVLIFKSTKAGGNNAL